MPHLKQSKNTVTNLQAELQSSVAAATVPGGGPELEAEFFKHLTQLSEDHLQDLKERLFLTIDDGCPAEEGGCQQRTGRGNEDPRYRASCLAPRSGHQATLEQMKAEHADPAAETARTMRRDQGQGKAS